ncbi:hypothetical protein [Halolamina salifodinae]|uniref:Uncharacterized protein n=1 Tax=Halolamina salifodinae TaxID=1202767 RepID=A0A8T4H215_9EURY|nr:hypothetical protein [Halolamina salifodinae]MBP1987864.1 hypothetical protein [Halolamina salifodinae]
MGKRQRKNTNGAGGLRAALDAAECEGARRHIRESMQFPHLDSE